MSRSPSLTHKAVGDIVPLWYDWSDELLQFCPGDTIAESHWSVDQGTTTAISGNPYFPTINGPITQCFIENGTANETAVINNSILCYPSGVKLVRRFPVLVIEGPFEPPAVPIIMLPDGLPSVVELGAFIGAMPGNTIWVDTTSAYPNGTLYVCVPQNSAWVVDGLNVVQGQLVKWVEWHIADGATGVPMSRVLHATAPARIDGGDSADLTADRTFSVNIGTTAGTAAAGDDVRFTQINGAGAPAPPFSSGYYKWILAVSSTGGSSSFGIFPPSALGIPVVSGSPASGNFIVWNGSEFVYTPIVVSTTLPLTGGGGFNPTLGINLVGTAVRGAVPPVPGSYNAVLTSDSSGAVWLNINSLSVQWIGDVKVTNSPTSIGQVLTYTGLDGSSNKTAAWT